MAQKKRELIDGTPLPQAHRCVVSEASGIQAEIDAFEDFFDRLGEIRPQQYRADGGTRTAFTSQTRSSSSSQEAVQAAYRETVLAVEHWKDAYGEETALESIANEFGADVATGLTGGSATWSSLLWNQLRSASEEAITTRQETIQVLERERQQLEDLQNSLDEIGDELARIERNRYPFTDRSSRLTEIHQQLEQLADEQQAYLCRRETSNEDLFPSLVYRDLDTNYPGLTSIATARETYDRIELHHWAGMR